MVVLTVLEKCYGFRWRRFLKIFEDMLSPLVGDLDVQFKILGKTGENWIQVEVIGSDVPVVTHYFKQKFGLAPISLENVNLFNEVRGKIVDAGRVGYGLYVDVGVSSPRHIDVLLPLHVLRSQLANGIKLSVNNIVEAFALYDNRPLSIQVTRIDRAKGEVEGRLSTSQSALFEEWVSLDFDRVLVLGAPFSEVRRIVKRSPVERDVIKILPLGFLEQLLLCKLGTEGPGLIKGIGSLLPKTPIHCFSPKRARIIREDS
jgi:hypothetical protein